MRIQSPIMLAVKFRHFKILFSSRSRLISTSQRVLCKEDRPKKDKGNVNKKTSNDSKIVGKYPSVDKIKQIQVDFAAENEKRIAEILEYYSQYEKELSSGGYKDPEIEPWLETDEEKENYPVDLVRGVAGVFDLHEVVAVLRNEKARDICCIEMPKEMSYADYIVTCTPLGTRHSNAICQTIYSLYKKKRSGSDPQVITKPEKNSDWAVLDLGNVVVHVMTDEIRRRYDIETLWAVGHEYDDLSISKSIVDKLEDNLKSLQSDEEWIKYVKTKK